MLDWREGSAGQGPGIYCDSDKIGNISWPSVNTTPALISNMIMGRQINMFVSSNRDYLGLNISTYPVTALRSLNIKILNCFEMKSKTLTLGVFTKITVINQ